MKTKSLWILVLTIILIIGILLVIQHTGINTYNPQPNFTTNHVLISIPVGAYSNYSLNDQQYPFGVVDKNLIEKLSLDNPIRYLARLIWFEGSGHLEYQIKNPLSGNNKIKVLRLFFEACSEAPYHDLNQKTDISVYINGKKVGTYTITGDFGEKRGKYTPEWWPIENTQYGLPILIEVREDGTYIERNYTLNSTREKTTNTDFQKISDVSMKDLNLNQDTITIKIGVDKDAEHKGGMNLFGENFGNYPDALILELEYEGEKIYQPKIGDIINNPEKYRNKTVILTVHPGGWSCPPKKATLLPEGFSRSATMIYDDTGCLYGSGEILIGKILSPEMHSLTNPGNETLVILGKVRLDKNKVPYISSV